MNRKNKKGHRHGYWEHKYPKGKLSCKHTPNNRMYLGYAEWYNTNGKIKFKQISI